ncbi:MAG: multiheme c-type cytochrome [Acidobacteriota bacterium]
MSDVTAGLPTTSGWRSWSGRLTMAVLLIETLTGLAMTFGPFHAAVQWGALLHTGIGLLTLLPVAWYVAAHWLDTRHYRLSHVALLGYLGLAALAVCAFTGVVLTGQGFFGVRTGATWRQVHLLSTYALLVTALPHVLILLPRLLRRGQAGPAVRYLGVAVAATAAGMAVVLMTSMLYGGEAYVNEFPADYSYPYGPDRPFAPSLARTDTNSAFDARSLAGSESCGTSGCHEEIVKEWLPSAHRYAAMDPLFQGVQKVMAKQNGPESTRYCGGCHDPISLFSGTKNLFTENLTGQHGFQEGVSCLICHAVRETDLKGNANYVVTQYPEYLWQWATSGLRRVARDFLIRTYPAQHTKLSKRMYKAPEYCAGCHKQFIDQEVNQVGWVQLQNQYDNWAASHWRVEGDPTRTVECRECHMPLVDSSDPASGDSADYNRTPDDGKHRSHRFLAANTMVPAMLKLPGWEEQVRLIEQWLKGERRIPEIEKKWAEGPIVKMALEVPDTVTAGADLPVRVVFTANKVGHDFPTGPLDIIQSWLELHVTDDHGNEIFHSGTQGPDHFIEQGSFLFKAEPIDQYGNLIDRHNLWEMVGVRYKRALFPGFTDAVDFMVDCPASLADPSQKETATTPGSAPRGTDTVRIAAPATPGRYHITATLQYRKVDQFLLNFLLGEDSGITAPVVTLTRAEATVEVAPS